MRDSLEVTILTEPCKTIRIGPSTTPDHRVLLMLHRVTVDGPTAVRGTAPVGLDQGRWASAKIVLLSTGYLYNVMFTNIGLVYCFKSVTRFVA